MITDHDELAQASFIITRSRMTEHVVQFTLCLYISVHVRTLHSACNNYYKIVVNTFYAHIGADDDSKQYTSSLLHLPEDNWRNAKTKMCIIQTITAGYTTS